MTKCYNLNPCPRRDLIGNCDPYHTGGIVRPCSYQKESINLCMKHYQASNWDDRDVQVTGHQSCDICKER